MSLAWNRVVRMEVGDAGCAESVWRKLDWRRQQSRGRSLTMAVGGGGTWLALVRPGSCGTARRLLSTHRHPRVSDAPCEDAGRVDDSLLFMSCSMFHEYY